MTCTSLELGVLSLVSQGCMLQLLEYKHPLLVPVGYAEIWLDRDMMFYVELSDCSTGHQHILRFASFNVRANQVTFYDAAGVLIAGLAPFNEWPELDVGEMQALRAQWQKDLSAWALAQCQEQGRAWRHLPMP
jgi:hypothetical protein